MDIAALRHSTAHIMAQAVQHLFPNVKLAIGPSIDDGFYYDFDVEESFTDNDLVKISTEMQKIIQQKLPFEKKIMEKTAALNYMNSQGQIYKTELIRDLVDTEISFYTQGDFTDLCRGPHIENTGLVPAFKLLKVSGAYWRGNEKNKMLQRIYGTAFASEQELADYLHFIDEAQKRDHRKLGKQLDLFSFHEEAPGMPFFHAKGMTIWNQLIEYWQTEHLKLDYQLITTPTLLMRELWETSGHWMNYKENMYTSQVDEQDYAIKPMNCPGSILVYKEKMHSYREFPLRMGEVGLVHRHEKRGVLSGLFRVRAFHQDDAHIFMLENQIKHEILTILDLANRMYSIFGLTYHLELSTRPDKYIGSLEVWEYSTAALKEALDSTGMPYKINEGDGAFYGPKIDIHIQDALKRTWQCGTIQLDMNLPERFDLTYIDAHNQKQRPIMIHRVIYGSLERFIGIIIEHFAGNFPLWLAPEQIRILPLAEAFHDYAKTIANTCRIQKLRVTLDLRNEKLGLKIRESEIDKIPYVIVIGQKEVDANQLSIRHRLLGDLGKFSIDTLIARILPEINEKQLLTQPA